MQINKCNKALKFLVALKLKTNLLIKSGEMGEYTDSTIEKTPDGKLHINGYIWNSLLRRAVSRINDGDKIAAAIGKNNGEEGVSPLWCETSIVELPRLDTKTGNKISRKWGAADIWALYLDEIVPPGIELKLNFNYFCDDSTIEDIKDKISSALWVINKDIENIGGGWSYGYGRLEVLSIQYRLLDLSNENDRETLWQFKGLNEYKEMALKKPEISKLWVRYKVKAGIADGQLLAIHTGYPLFDTDNEYKGKDLPDHFIFRRYIIENDNPKAQVLVTGKAFRQAVLSSNIERKFKTLGEHICEDTTKTKECTCKRCRWFGSTDKGGIIAVLDAEVKNPNTETLHRIQLCEHSMQNINLFSGEYLSKGDFEFEIIIDTSREELDTNGLTTEIETLLDEMKDNGNAPPGWYRIGATSTCTGQIKVKEWNRHE